MASLQVEYRGRKSFYRIQGRVHGRPYTLRLGNIGQQKANEIAGHIDCLERCKNKGVNIDASTHAWLAACETKLHEKITKAGLARKRVEKLEIPSLVTFLTDYISSRSDVKPRTLITYENVKRNLLAAFDSDRQLDSFTLADGRYFRKWLGDTEKLSKNTARRRCGIARQMFTEAIRLNLITENPLEGIAVTVSKNNERQEFVSTETIDVVIDKCPSMEWKLLFVLARYCGLRIPSEIQNLTWDDILWESNRIRIRSPKTEHLGKAERFVPIFPEMLKYLLDGAEQAAVGELYVFQNLRNHQNPGTAARRIIKKAGVIPWKKTWTNLRSSRETELVKQFPIQDVCSWLGNSPKVALAHYLQTQDGQFELAANFKTKSDDKCDDTNGALAPIGTDSHDQGTVRIEHDSNELEKQNDSAKINKKAPTNSRQGDSKRAVAIPCNLPLIGRAGLEPATKGL